MTATREIGRLSPVSGYIRLEDCDPEQIGLKGEFLLPEVVARRAAIRKIREELDLDGDPELVDTLPYYSSTTESLYFYAFSLKLQSYVHRFPSESYVRPWDLADLLKLRDYQMLSQAEALLRLDMPARHASLAARVLSLNLTLGGREELGRQIVEQIRQDNSSDTLLDEIRHLRTDVTPGDIVPGLGSPIEGLAGLTLGAALLE